MAKKDNKEEKKPAEQAEPKVTVETPEDCESSEVEVLKAELEQQKDLLLRTAAEFDNYKRRTERERIAAGEYVRASTLKAFLTVIDNIDRSAGTDPSSPEYAKGIEMIVKQLTDAIASLGLTEIEAAGCKFDPTLHEAVMHIEDPDADENTVIEVLQKGYRVGDVVVRHAMVKVAN